MKLLLKIVRGSINKWQIGAFTAVNIVGLIIVILGIYVYARISKAFEQESGIIKDEYIVISKPVSSLSTISSLLGRRGTKSFDEEEIKELSGIDGIQDIGRFENSKFQVIGSVSIGDNYIATDMFLESVPDRFLDFNSSNWKASANDSEIPIVVPRSYLDMYNYGYAVAKGSPQIGEKLLSIVRGNLEIRGNGAKADYSCRLLGFSDRINSILVPESFLQEANARYGERGADNNPGRLILLVSPKRFAEVSGSLEDKGYVIEKNAKDKANISSALKMALIAVTGVGAVMSILAFALLLVSILLMIEKNKSRNRTLSCLGYSDREIASPYRLVALISDFIAVLCATAVSLAMTPIAIRITGYLYPEYNEKGYGVIILTAVSIMIFLGLLHYLTIGINAKKKS